MNPSIETLQDLFDRGLIVSSPDFRAEKQPDGRNRIHLARTFEAPPLSSVFAVTFNDSGSPEVINVQFTTDWSAA